MKKIFLIASALLLGSCSNWLDVPPATSVEQKELFKTEAGFQEAVVGLYGSAAEFNLYGGIFGFEVPDAMMQNYTYAVSDPKDFIETASFDWEYGQTRTRFNAIWNKAYNTIANCNLILKNLEEKRSSGMFHEDVAEIVEAEALAMRAYLHFDMLRLCVPVRGGYATTPDAGNATQQAIPYVTTYSKDVTPLSTASQVVDKAIADLLRAKELLEGRDPILSDEYLVNYNNTGESVAAAEEQVTIDGEKLPLFLQNRRHRMNYYAVCGALARAYLWKASVYGDAGAYAPAAENANTVIAAGKFKWMESSYAHALPSSKTHDKLAYNEIMLGFFVENDAHIEEIKTRFDDISSGYYIAKATLDRLYETNTVGYNDLRVFAWFDKNANPTNAKIIKYLRNAESTAEGNLHHLVVPQMRLGEMYYIVAECIRNGIAVGGFADEWAPLTYVRTRREVLTAYDAGASFYDELLKEYRKETYGESQGYLNFKRLRSVIWRDDPRTSYTNDANDTFQPKISDSGYEWLPTDETNNRI